MSKISINSFSQAVADVLKDYNRDVIENTKNIIHDVSKEFKSNTKKDAPRGQRNKYNKYIDVKTTYESISGVTDTWYVKDPEYRLTHLIKNGHQTRNGGRTKGNDFIDKNYFKAEKEIEERISKEI